MPTQIDSEINLHQSTNQSRCFRSFINESITLRVDPKSINQPSAQALQGEGGACNFAAMDNKQSAKLREQIETEMKMQNQWLQEMDLSDAKPLPASVT